MRSLVVLFALCALSRASLLPLAQPPHHPALVLDGHGRPLDTAEVIQARALHLQAKHLEHAPLYQPTAYAAPAVYASPAVYAAPAAVSHQSRVDVHSSPALASYAVAAPALSYHGLHAHSHLLKKRSLALAHVAYAAPAAVSHQSRVDVRSSPAVYAHAAPVYAHATPVYAHAAPVYAHATPVYAHAAPVYAHAAPAAVSHQSRVDVRSSPAVVTHGVSAAPLALAHHAPLAYSSHSSPLVHAW